MDAGPAAFTTLIRLRPLQAHSEKELDSRLRGVQQPGEHWSYVASRTPDGGAVAWVAPTNDDGPDTPWRFPYVEVHQSLAAWVLLNAWRARQLVDAGSSLRDTSQTIPAAACVRSLAETAAQLHTDARKIATAWDTAKRSGRPGPDTPQARHHRDDLLEGLNQALVGAKFTDRVPDLQEAYGRVQRSNVLSAIDRLTRFYGADWQRDYQWLCNAVHPSIGNFLAFSSPALGHDSGTHTMWLLAGMPLELVSATGSESVRTIQTAINRMLDRSAALLTTTLDAMIRLTDDVGLVTRAGRISPDRYWRDHRIVDRKQPCPCRSGRRASRCYHDWGDAGPSIPDPPTASAAD
ncbi:hypothetical protein AB0N29_01715 [Nocardioides sp. NPDC092400]|uniref:hypothetical protein n=1 Tax=Nocardioides sp. NPDC092400 TaxID=3155196 RepID=UPI0034313D8D